MTKCSIPDCGNKAHARGWCGTHYRRWKRLGSTELACKPARACDAPGCARPHYSLGLCVTHYQRFKRIGSLELTTATIRERFNSRWIANDSGCWIWNGQPSGSGYGRMSINDQLQYAHRVSYEIHVGEIPDGLTIDHLCRVRMCVNPKHLEPVTIAENTRRELAVRYAAKEPA